MSFALYSLATLLVIVVYLLGVRFIGKPMAVYSWRYWHESPELPPTVVSFLLFPGTHIVTWFEGVQFSRDIFVPEDGRGGLFVPVVAGWYTAEKKFTYIRHASFAWPLRLAVTMFMYAFVCLVAVSASLRWLIHGPVGRRILGNVE